MGANREVGEKPLRLAVTVRSPSNRVLAKGQADGAPIGEGHGWVNSDSRVRKELGQQFRSHLRNGVNLSKHGSTNDQRPFLTELAEQFDELCAGGFEAEKCGQNV